jgi:tetratricopeptide (TPR) repeat protein
VPSEKYDKEKVHLILADSLYREGRYQLSLSQYSDFLDIYPNSKYSSHVLETMAEMYEKEQVYAKALHIYRQLYQSSGVTTKGLSFYYNQARLLYMMGETRAAENIYKDIISIRPDSAYARKAEISAKLSHLFDELDSDRQEGYSENSSSQNE